MKTIVEATRHVGGRIDQRVMVLEIEAVKKALAESTSSDDFHRRLMELGDEKPKDEK